MKVFISYRRTDASSAARQLAEALRRRFGPDAVFFDARDLVAGTEWRREIVRRVQASDVALAVIGPHWETAADERARRSVLDSTLEDVVRVEIETAFAQGVVVVPVLVDEAEMPRRDALPRPFRPLTAVHAQTLHHASWERDFDALVETLEGVAARPRNGGLPPPSPRPAGRAAPTGRTDGERIARHLADGSVVVVVGSGANLVDRDGAWEQGARSLPDSAELARHLARRFRIESPSDDLARVSEYVSLTEGKVDLCRTLRELLIKAGGEPTSVHSFVARIPKRLRDAGGESFPLVVTTNYDTALERAFDAVHEPYDLALFVATGEHRGRFLHVPWWDPDDQGPTPVMVPNEYVDLPIDEDGALDRTVIVKLHGGAAELGSGGPQLRDNFVITEDDYIGYLAASPVESLVPVQILNKIRDSHFLFLGCHMHDWTGRVFLRRVWGEQQLQARSWAADPGLDDLDRELWEHFGVTVLAQPVRDLLEELDSALARLADAHPTL